MQFEHIPGTENPADILTKPLPWFMLKVYVEPLLLWKGDTANTPSGSSNPEGSDVNPGSVPSEMNHEQDSVQVGVRNGQVAFQIPTILYNNQYAVLADTYSTESKNIDG